MNTKPSVEEVMGENNLIICSIQHPEDHNFLSKLSDFMQEHGYSFFQRYSYHNLEKIFLLAENLTKASMEKVVNFVEKEQESARIIHFPHLDDKWITFGSWGEVHEFVSAIPYDKIDTRINLEEFMKILHGEAQKKKC
ncbi:MAG: hypothetical protein FP824_06520 [Euryarchaeota archaeon]|nr:hypothetical protein [Euryarchaeota archaeon]